MSCAVFAAAVAGTNAQAVVKTQVVDVTGIGSYGVLGDSENTVINLNLGALATVTGVSYDLIVNAYTPSWLSEIQLQFTDSNSVNGLSFTPGFGQDKTGPLSTSDSVDLVGYGLSFNVGADGILRLEFAEAHDDGPGVDGRWESGTLTFVYDDHVSAVPEPETYAMMLMGLLFIGAIARRRRSS